MCTASLLQHITEIFIQFVKQKMTRTGQHKVQSSSGNLSVTMVKMRRKMFKKKPCMCGQSFPATQLHILTVSETFE